MKQSRTKKRNRKTENKRAKVIEREKTKHDAKELMTKDIATFEQNKR